ncbi:dienelactone hydrolase family protein [Rossellomorea vietnamensis]|jgi:dienelactone hydrolase|uniref:Dienelactone hydrolase family protein n=1 Tax=Rossellomorea vietnamensis TaxID=218284 RepID=A0A6I6UMG8_9BACI|nr:dienelactone hydrolase family protein [Rossellomorea vietnamensis]QHE60231.1 dienelactone hydrolase family protein [Rossellomorea vietnamensis]
MIRLHQNSSTLVIVIHEIYGINQHIQDFCAFISSQGTDVICPDFLKKGSAFDYSQEEMAYRSFIKDIGFEEAVVKIKIILSIYRQKYKKIVIIGFSAGATVAWLCSDDERVDGVIGYYGSRIRNYLEVKPLCPTMLFFPEEEPSFQVDEVIARLRRKNIDIQKYSGTHGFSDPYSTNFHNESAQKARDRIIVFLTEKVE